MTGEVVSSLHNMSPFPLEGVLPISPLNKLRHKVITKVQDENCHLQGTGLFSINQAASQNPGCSFLVVIEAAFISSAGVNAVAPGDTGINLPQGARQALAKNNGDH